MTKDHLWRIYDKCPFCERQFRRPNEIVISKSAKKLFLNWFDVKNY